MLSRHVVGIVWAVPSFGNNRDWIEQDTSHIPVPIVFISMQSHPKLSVIAVDNRRGSRMATKHLLDQGHQVIGLITGPLDWWEARQRHLGWRDALAEAGIVADDDFIVEGDWRAASGEQGLRQLLEPRPDISAIFACNDQMALGALLAARGMGRRVPEDLAVVGFDDIPEAAYFHPPLSTVRQDLVELGYCAVRELRRRIEPSQQVGGAVHPKTILLQPELVIRTSSDQGEGR
jgi:LacI family transcriptional regulator